MSVLYSVDSFNRFSPLGIVSPRSHREIIAVLFNLSCFRMASWEYPMSLRCFLKLFGMSFLFTAMQYEHTNRDKPRIGGKSSSVGQLLWKTLRYFLKNS